MKLTECCQNTKKFIEQSTFSNFLFIVFWLFLLTARFIPQIGNRLGPKALILLVFLAGVILYDLKAKVLVYISIFSLLFVILAVLAGRIGTADYFSALAIFALIAAIFVAPLKDFLLRKWNVRIQR